MKTNKLWSILMMLILVLGTVISFSSCSSDDDDNNNGNGSGNYIVVNGIKAGIASCNMVSSNRLEMTIEDATWEGEIIVKATNGNIQNGTLKVNIEGGMEKKKNGSDECGFEFDNATCTVNIDNGNISFSANSIKGLYESRNGEKQTTANINYNGSLTMGERHEYK